MSLARLSLLALSSVLIACAAQQDASTLADEVPPTRTKEGIFSCITLKFSYDAKPTKACFGNFLHKEDEEDHNPFRAEKTCYNWCTHEPCLALVGNRTQECGACGPAAKCHPGAEDWTKFKANPNELRCEAYCEANACPELKGNPAVECAACKGDYKCRPGAEHFDDYLERKHLEAAEAAQARTEL